jgi:hypothetical protein
VEQPIGDVFIPFSFIDLQFLKNGKHLCKRAIHLDLARVDRCRPPALRSRVLFKAGTRKPSACVPGVPGSSYL